MMDLQQKVSWTMLAGMLLIVPQWVTMAADTTLVNGGFEELDPAGLPSPWYKYVWVDNPRFSLDSVVVHSGKYAAKISGSNMEGCWGQDVTLQGHHIYRVQGWIKTEDLQGGRGACIILGFNNSSVGGVELRGTHDWTFVSGEFYFPEGVSDWPPTIRCYAGGSGTAWFDDVSLIDLGTPSWSYVYFDTPHFNVKLLSSYESYKPLIEKWLELGYQKYTYYTGFDLNALTSKIHGNPWVHHPKCYFMFLRPDDMWWPGWGGGLTIMNQCQVNVELLLGGLEPGTVAQGIMWHELANAWGMVWGTRNGEALGTPWWFANEGHAGFLEHHGTCDLGSAGIAAKMADYAGALAAYHEFMSSDTTVGGGYVTLVLVESLWAKYGWSVLRQVYRALQSGEIRFPTRDNTSVANSSVLAKYLSEVVGENLVPFLRDKFKVQIDPAVEQELSALPTADVPIVQSIAESIPVIRYVERLENVSEAIPCHITAVVNSSPAPVTSVKIWYATDSLFQAVQMLDDGAHGDSAAGDGIYGAWIPPQEVGSVVRYYVTAENALGEQTVDPFDAPYRTHRFAVWSDTSLVASYQFESGSGNVVEDSSPFGNDGVLVGEATYCSETLHGQYALCLHGDSAYVEVPHSPFLELHTFTVEMWIRPDSLGSERCLLTKPLVTGAPVVNFEIRLAGDGRVIGTRFLRPLHSIELDSAVTTGRWYHIAYVWDGDSTHLYLADSGDRLIQKVSRRDTASIPSTLFRKQDLPLCIGGGCANKPHFQGLIDDVRIYNYARLQSDVLSAVSENSVSRVSPSIGLFRNYPNPFNATTTISYELRAPVHCRLEILNVLGEEVACLVEGVQTAGLHRVRWNAGEQPSGVYFYRLSAGAATKIGKMLLLR